MARSTAYLEFRSALSMAAELMRQEASLVKDPPRPPQQNIAMGLRGGAAVLMVAAFEAYLDDLIAGKVQEIAAAAPPVSFHKLPDVLRVWNVFETLNLAMKGPKYQRAGQKVTRLSAVKVASQSIAQDGLNPTAFIGTGGNPSKDAVKDLFKRIGVTDVFALSRVRFEKKWKQPVAANFAGDKLNEIVQRRHRVAHRADALSISRTDLRESERFLRVFGEVLDMELSAYTKRLCRQCR